MRKLLSAVIGCVLLSSSLNADSIPEWAKRTTQKREGNTFTAVTKGQGPSDDLARKDALAQARSAAVDQLATGIEVNSVAVTTEQTTAYYEQVSANHVVKNLNCEIQDEYLQESDDGSHIAFVKSKCDLANAKVVAKDQPSTSNDREVENGSLVKNREAINSGSIAAPTVSKHVLGSTRILSLSVIPPCVDILIKGRSRSIRCLKNPIDVSIYPEDRQLTIRGPKEYRPKVLDLQKQRPATGSSTESLEVLLERF